MSFSQRGHEKIGNHLLPGRTTWNRCNTDCEGRPPGSDRKSLGRCRPWRFVVVAVCSLSLVRPRQRNDQLAVRSASGCCHYGRPSDGTPRRFSNINFLPGWFAETNQIAETTTAKATAHIQNNVLNIRNSNAISLCLSPTPYAKSVISKVAYYHLRSCTRDGAPQRIILLPIFLRRSSELDGRRAHE